MCLFIGSCIGFYMQFGMLESRPEFVAYYERLSNRPARLRALKIDEELMAVAK